MLSPLVRAGVAQIGAIYSKHRERALSTIGVQAVGNSSFFQQLKAGKVKLSMHSVDAVLVHMARDWPEKAKWPDNGIPRPTPAQVKHFHDKPKKKT